MTEAIDLKILMEKFINEMDLETVEEKLKEMRNVENKFSGVAIEIMEKRIEMLGVKQ